MNLDVSKLKTTKHLQRIAPLQNIVLVIQETTTK